MLGIGGFVTPTLIMFALLLAITRQVRCALIHTIFAFQMITVHYCDSFLWFVKVILIRAGHAMRMSGLGSSSSANQSDAGGGESSKSSNETLTTIVSMTTCHLIVYLPFPIVWTSRISFGYLFPGSTYQLLWALQRFCLMLAQLVHIWNIFFYFTRYTMYI